MKKIGCVLRKKYILVSKKSSFLHGFSTLITLIGGMTLMCFGFASEGTEASLRFLWVWIAFCVYTYWLNPKVLYFCCDHVTYEVTLDEVSVSVFDGGELDPVEVYSSSNPQIAEIVIKEELHPRSATLVVKDSKGGVIKELAQLVPFRP